MQIIIIQSEIEQAIKDYISSRLTVADGQRIDIALSATRGEDGFKATIDIVAADQQPAMPEPVKNIPSTPAKAAPATTASRAAVAVPKGNAEAVLQPLSQGEQEKAAQNQAQVQEASTAGAVVDNGAVQTASAEPSSTEPAAAQATDGAAAPAAAPSRSLFAGLKKPVNSAAA